MPRAKAPPRVKGPYSERDGTRFRIRVCDLTEHRDLYFSTMKEALAAKEETGREFQQSDKGRSLGEIIDEYTRDKVQRGLCNAKSASEHQARLRVWLCDRLEDDISKLTAKRAAALYVRLVSQPTLKTGKPPMAATHRFYLKLAQALFRWAVRKGYLRDQPACTRSRLRRNEAMGRCAR